MDTEQDTTQIPFEEWRPVVGFEGRYEVSNTGKVRRVPCARGRTNIILPPMELKCSPDDFGYPSAGLAKDSRQGHYRVHVLVMAAFVGPRPKGYDVNHIDANRANNHVSNLEYCTRAENIRHAKRLGRLATGDRNGSRLHPESTARGDRNGSRTRPESLARGERQWKAMLTEAKVREIRQLDSEGIPKIEIARRLGVTYKAVCPVLAGRTWKHVV